MPERSVNYMFTGGPGRVLLRSPEWLTLFDVGTRKVVREIQIQSRFPVKFVHWSNDFSRVALLARFSVMICDQDLNDICTIYENAKLCFFCFLFFSFSFFYDDGWRRSCILSESAYT